MVSYAREMFKRYPKLFMEMYLHSMEENPEHPDDNSVIYSKLMANAQGKAEPYWVPENVDMEPVYDDFRAVAEEIKQFDKTINLIKI